jgi:hypothetical protein
LTVNISDHSKVKFGDGFEVLEITTGFESRWILIKNLPPSMTKDTITGILEPFGQLKNLRYNEQASTVVKAEFSTFSEAERAASHLNGAQVFGKTLTASLAVNNTGAATGIVQDATVVLTWDAPSRVGYAGFEDLSDAESAIAAADVSLRGSFVSAALHKGLPALGLYTIRIQGLPPDATPQDIQKLCKCRTEDIMMERPNYTSLAGIVRGIRTFLEELGQLTFEMVPPSRKEQLFRAWATFPSPQLATDAAQYMNSRPQGLLRRCKLRAYHINTISYALSPDTFAKIDKEIELLYDSSWSRFRHGAFVRIDRRPGGPCHIKLHGDNLKNLRTLKSEFETILHGEIVRQDGKVCWDRFFGHPVGRLYLDDLERQHPPASIRTDSSRRHIVISGSSDHRQAIRQRILEKHADLSRQKVRTIPLSGQLLGFLMSTDLLSLQRRLGPENVILDLKNRCVKIRGNDQVFDMAQQAVQRAQKAQGASPEDLVTCPICFNEVTSPVTLDCGHSWCRACLSGYLVAAINNNRLLPLTCLGDDSDCPDLISIRVAQAVLTQADFDAIINASFANYIHSRPNVFHYCPTSDCPQVYRVSSQNTVLQCPSCMVRICPNCHVESHEGLECAERNARRGGGETTFREWTKQNDVKFCPSCHVPIERSEGCNHMTCTRCNTHICWVCLKTFHKGHGIYDHMRQEHGGIGI